MSDFAPFVAAMLRDKTVIELQEEIVKLRNERAQLRVVEVTGPKGAPIYARGRLDEVKDYCSEYELGDDQSDTTWVLILEQVQPCPLSALRSVQVRLGGACKGTFRNIFDGIFESHPYDGKNQKIVHFDIGASFLCGFTVKCKVHGWPEDSWRSAMDNWDLIDNGTAKEFLSFLVETVDKEQPRGKVVEFPDVCFEKDTIPPGLLQF